MQEDSKEIGKRKCIAYPHLELYIAINLILFLCSIGAFCILSVNKNSMLKIVNIVVAVMIVLTFISIFVYTTFSGWNSVVIFDEEKAFQKRFNKVIEWRWDDISEIDYNTNMPRIFNKYNSWPQFRMTCHSHEKVLVFKLNRVVYKMFTKLCTNEDVNLKFQQLVSECNYGYLKNSRKNSALTKKTILYLIYNFLLLAIGITGVVLYIIEKKVGCIICFTGIGVCLIIELIVFIIIKARKGKKNNLGDNR